MSRRDRSVMRAMSTAAYAQSRASQRAARYIHPQRAPRGHSPTARAGDNLSDAKSQKDNRDQ
jgi:hypothetical protein